MSIAIATAVAALCAQIVARLDQINRGETCGDHSGGQSV